MSGAETYGSNKPYSRHIAYFKLVKQTEVKKITWSVPPQKPCNSANIQFTVTVAFPGVNSVAERLLTPAGGKKLLFILNDSHPYW